MTIDVPRSLDIRAGQYVNVWIPSVSFWSFLQGRRFTIASWEAKEGVTSLDLLVQPRKGLTQKLYACAEYYRERPGKGIDRISDERPRTIINLGKPQDTLCESVEQGGKCTAIDYHKSHETLSESIEEGVENIQPTRFGYERYEGEPQWSDFRLAIISGPHGMEIPVGDYGKVLMIATVFETAGTRFEQLPCPDAGNTLDLAITEFW